MKRAIKLSYRTGLFYASIETTAGAVLMVSADSRREALGRLQDAHAKSGAGHLNLPDFIILGPDAEEGMPATYSIGSDSYAYTVTKVLSEKRIELTMDRHHKGLHVPAATSEVRVATLRQDGRWRMPKSNAGYFTLGERHTHFDPNF